MKKSLSVFMIMIGIVFSARAHSDDWSNGQWGVIGGAIGYVIGRSQVPQQVIIQPSSYGVIHTPVYPNWSAPRYYRLPDPPYIGVAPLFEEHWQYEPYCQCQVKVFNQIGWR